MEKYIIVTNWEKVSPEDFYLQDEWLAREQDKTQEESQKIRQDAKDGKIYQAYIVPALSYALYWQMDATSVYINSEWDEVVNAESAVIGTDFNYKQEYEY